MRERRDSRRAQPGGRPASRVGRACCDSTAAGCPACRRRLEDLWRWRGHVARFLSARAPTPEHAADALATTYVVAWQRLPAVPREGDAARGWLCVTAWRVLANLRRRDQHQDRLAEALRAPAGPGAGDAAVEDRLVLVDAYRALSPADRRVLALAAAGGGALADLAERLGCSVNAAGTRLHRARRRLETTAGV